MLRDFRQEIFEVFIRLQVIRFCCLCYIVNDRTGFCSCNRINHYPILLPDAESADRLLRCAVMHRHFSIIQKCFQVFFLVQAVLETFPGLAFFGDAADILFQPLKIGLHQWADADLSAFFAFFYRQFFQDLFFPENRLYHGKDEVRKAFFLFFFRQCFCRVVKAASRMAPASCDLQVPTLIFDRVVYLVTVRNTNTAEIPQEFPRMACIARLLVLIQDDRAIPIHICPVR